MTPRFESRKFQAPLLAALVLLAVLPGMAAAETLRLAVASNFTSTARELAGAFMRATGHDVRLSSASTGTLYAQIVNGAPFDVLLAADAVRPALLENQGLAVAGSRFTYATGRLVLVSRDPAAGGDCRRLLAESAGRVAIANPDTAPYGAAARQALTALGLVDAVTPRLVYGENIAQAFQFVATGNAELGFVAGSQLDGLAMSCTWEVPAGLHEPIDQQAVQLRSADNAAAAEFLAFLRGTGAKEIIRSRGYRLDEDS